MEDIKVVVSLKEGRAFIGVQAPGTDPVMEVAQAGTLEEALGAVPGVVARARERWATSPRNPKAELPAPPPPPAPAPRPVAGPARRTEAQDGAMSRML